MTSLIRELQKSAEGSVVLMFGGLAICGAICAFLVMAGMALLAWSGYR